MTSTQETLPIIWRSAVDEATYEEARVGRVFNLRRPHRFPAAVVKASKESHIVSAVKLAIEQGYRVSVRSGGHSWAAWSVRDGAILIDLGNYEHLDLQQSKGIVVVSPSTTGRKLNGFLRERGLMFAGGHCPDVGVGGFLLQGGMGWNCRGWGWACEQVEAIDVVTAEGELVHADANQNKELYWAARGAGPGFPGIVTKFYLRVRNLPKAITKSLFLYPMKQYQTVMKWITQLAPDCDADMEVAAVGCAPFPELETSENVIVCSFVVFKDDRASAEKALEPVNRLRPTGALLEVINQATDLPTEYAFQDDINPLRHNYCTENAYIRNDEDVVAAMEEAFTTIPGKQTFTLWMSLAPRCRQSLPDMALSMQSDHYFAVYSVWKDPAEDDLHMTWNKDIMKRLERHSCGAYLGDSDFQVRKTKYWSDQAGEKLMRLRRELDPKGIICGYLDAGDQSGIYGLPNQHEWQSQYKLA